MTDKAASPFDDDSPISLDDDPPIKARNRAESQVQDVAQRERSTRSVNVPADLHARLAAVAEERVVGINLLVRKACEEALKGWENLAADV